MFASNAMEKTRLLSPDIESKIAHEEDVISQENVRKTNTAAVSSLLVFAFLLMLAFLAPTSLRLRMSSQEIPFKRNSHSIVPSDLWGKTSKPFPTGAFWTNFVVESGDGAANLLPYGVKCIENGIHISYGATRRSVTDKWIRDGFDTDLQISSSESYQRRSVSYHDDLSVTMSYALSSGTYDALLVKGSPFVTVSFKGSTPVIQSNTMHITNVETYALTHPDRNYYIVTLGNYQKWLVYTSFNTALTWSHSTDQLSASGSVTGVVRVAVLPSQDYARALTLLLKYAACIPTGATVQLAYPKPSSASVTYKFQTEGSGDLLMMALPHQVDILDTSSLASLLAQDSIAHMWSLKGKLVPVVGKQWVLTYSNIKSPHWVYDLEGRVISTTRLNDIAASLQLDVLTVPPSAQDPYSFGKEVARMAMLALIADNLGIADARKLALNNIEAGLTPWLMGGNRDAFVYDTTWGGIIPAMGLQDKQADYGSGWYNDHHFHYGYFVYVGAALAKLNRPYFDGHRAAFDALALDICNSDRSNSDFAYARHKDFFDGHSWASGLFQEANGKSQESSSEV
jgi:endo-1,3(4)-beta-glucanase